MATNEQLLDIRQQKMNALAAKHLHEDRLIVLNRLNTLVDTLAAVVPILYFVVRFLAKGTEIAWLIEGIWEVLAVILLASVSVKVFSRWQVKAERHNRLLADNITLAGEADYLLSDPQNLTADRIRWFHLRAETSERDDREALSGAKPEEKRAAFLEALKEFSPASAETRCPICNGSPWRFTPGSCQACGNTPVPKGS